MQRTEQWRQKYENCLIYNISACRCCGKPVDIDESAVYELLEAGRDYIDTEDMFLC